MLLKIVPMPYAVKCLLCGDDAEGVKNGTHFFRVPVDAEARVRWQTALQCNKLSSRSFICSKHFKADDLRCVNGQIFLEKHALPKHPDKTQTQQSDLISIPVTNLQNKSISSDKESAANSVISPMQPERLRTPEQPLQYISKIPIFHLQTVKCEEFGIPMEMPCKDTISQGTQTSIDDAPLFDSKYQISDIVDMEHFKSAKTSAQQKSEADELAKTKSTIQDLNELLKEKNSSIQTLQNKVLRQMRKINHLMKIIGNLRSAGCNYNIPPRLDSNCSPSNGSQSHAPKEKKVKETQMVTPKVETTKARNLAISKNTTVTPKADVPRLLTIQTRSQSMAQVDHIQTRKR